MLIPEWYLFYFQSSKTGFNWRKMSKYGVDSGPHFSVFGPNTGKNGTEKISYLDTFYAV